MLHHGGLGRHPVDGHLDGHHRRVPGALAQQVQEGLHGVVGVEQQHVPLLHLIPHGHLPVQPGGIRRRTGRVEEPRVRAVQPVGVFQNQGAGAGIALLRPKPQPPEQHLPQDRGLPLHLQPHRGQPLPPAQELRHLRPLVQVLLVHGLVIAQVRVPGDGYHRLLLHPVDPKDLPQVVGQDLLRPHEGAGPPRQRHDGRDHLRHAHDAKAPLLPVLQHGSGVQDLVLQMGEGVAGVDDLGRQQRAHGLLVPAPHILPVPVLQLPVGELLHPPLPQGVHDRPVHPVPLLHQRSHGVIDPPQLLRRGEASLVLPGIGGHDGQVRQAPHPDHEELVQVAGEDGEEPQPLHQGHGRVRRLLQHPPVKGQPAELPVPGVAQVPVPSSL